MDLKVSRQAVYKLMKAAKGLQKGTVLQQKIGFKEKQKILGRIDHLSKQEVLVSLSITFK